MTENTPNEASDHGDWAGVGAAFATLGAHLRDHAVSAGQAVKDTEAESARIVDGLTASLKTLVSQFDATVGDPAIGDSARAAATALLDAIKVEVNRR